MSFRNGSVSVRRFERMNREMGNGKWEMGLDPDLALRRFSFREIDDARGEVQSWGFCDPFDVSQVTTWADRYSASSGLAHLAVRFDKKLVSAEIFKAARKARFEAVMQERGIKKLSRQQRLAIEEEVMNGLLKETSPRTWMVECVWDPMGGTLLVDTLSGSNVDAVTDLLGRAFDVGPGQWRRLPGQKNAGKRGEDLRGSAIGFLHWLFDQWIGGVQPMTRYGPMVVEFSGKAKATMGALKLGVATDSDDLAERMTEAIKEGLSLSEASIVFVMQEEVWRFSLNEDLDVRGLRLPVPSCYGQAPLEVEGAITRIESVRQFYDLLDDVFDLYLAEREGVR